eukprot:scaffold75458_cov31-Tisochrysis_lutea.AAC.1
MRGRGPQCPLGASPAPLALYTPPTALGRAWTPHHGRKPPPALLGTFLSPPIRTRCCSSVGGRGRAVTRQEDCPIQPPPPPTPCSPPRACTRGRTPTRAPQNSPPSLRLSLVVVVLFPRRSDRSCRLSF